MDNSTNFQARVQPWMLTCFGAEISADTIERNHRFLEEALELVQACSATQSEAHQLVDYVFNRPIGEKSQEVGGVMVTLAALCLANKLDMHEAGETELTRIWTKIEQIRAKQASKPKHSPLPQPPSKSIESIVMNAILGNSHPHDDYHLVFQNAGEVSTVVHQIARAMQPKLVESKDHLELRQFLECMQEGEMTVSRGLELIDLWLYGKYSNDMLPAYNPVPKLKNSESIGYALLGTGNYLINHSAKHAELGAELVITIATENDKLGRKVGDVWNNPQDLLLQPEDMVVRIGFINPAGLDALEAQLKLLREVHFPNSISAHQQSQVKRIAELHQQNQIYRTAMLDQMKANGAEIEGSAQEPCATCGGAVSVHSPDGEYRGECPHCAPQVSTWAAVAAIEFALKDDSPMEFLRCWFEGNFEAIRKEWENVPDAVFIGADPLHPPTSKGVSDV